MYKGGSLDVDFLEMQNLHEIVNSSSSSSYKYDTRPNPGDEEAYAEPIKIVKQKRCPQTTVKGTICRLRCVAGKERCHVHEWVTDFVAVITDEERLCGKQCEPCYNATGVVVTSGLIGFYHALGKESFLCNTHFEELCSNKCYVI